MNGSKAEKHLEAAMSLASAHRKADSTTQEIHLIPDDQFVDVRLLEVSGSAPSSGDILPFRFMARPELGIEFPSVVIILSPSEWEDVKAGRLSLPPEWDLSKAKKL